MPDSGLNVTTAHPQQADPRPESAADSGLAIRDFHRSDLEAVMALERRTFSNPWSVAMMSLELAQAARVALVSGPPGRISGCAIASRHDRTWHLMKIAVSPEQRRRGIASRLLTEVLGRTDPELPVTLEVRAGNLAAIALYERFGFSALGRRPGYYADNGEDALLMWRGDPARAGVPTEAFSPVSPSGS